MSEPASPSPRIGAGRAAWVGIAVTLIVAWEGLQKIAWHDPIDPPRVNTVCYGHIEDVQIGDSYTKIQCEEMLAKDLPRYEAMVRKCIHVPMPPHRHAAIISFTYNVGGSALCRSSVAKFINENNIPAACDALLAYDHANGKFIQGLRNRRVAERKFCLRDD